MNNRRKRAKLTQWIRLMATPADVAILDTISEQEGDASLSATVRRLIREEAQRRGIEPGPEASKAVHGQALSLVDAPVEYVTE